MYEASEDFNEIVIEAHSMSVRHARLLSPDATYGASLVRTSSSALQETWEQEPGRWPRTWQIEERSRNNRDPSVPDPISNPQLSFTLSS
ncbi:unnamed protein product [Boreogadus saida]